MASKKRKSKISITPKSTRRRASVSNEPAMLVLKVLIFGVVIIALFLSMYDAAGKIGEWIKCVLTSLFGGGAFYVPFLCVFWFYLAILKVKGDGYKLKSIFSSIFLLSVTASGHLISGSYVESLSLKNLSFIMQEGRALLNGGLFGTYIGELFRMLTGDFLSVFLSVVLVIVSVCFMFSNIAVFLINKTIELFKKSKKEKTSKIFRVPGVKVDKTMPKPDGEIELPDGNYSMVFEMWDAMGNYAYSDAVTFDCIDGEIYTTVYEDY